MRKTINPIMEALGKKKPEDFKEYIRRMEKAKLAAGDTGNETMALCIDMAIAAAHLGYEYGQEEA